jgi:hypothetical protein
MKRSHLVGALSLVLVSLAAGYELRVSAEGPPTVQPVFYAGTIEADGKLARGNYTILLELYAAEKDGKKLCSSESKVSVDNGRFRVVVSQDCVSAMQTTPDAWAAVTFTGDDRVPHNIDGRTKVGAVPYAMEAQHAVEATSAKTAAQAMHSASADSAPSAKTADSATVANSLASAAIRIETTNCQYPTPVGLYPATDCTCNANEVAISGGAYAGQTTYKLSQSVQGVNVGLNLQVWRVSCVDDASPGNAVQCAVPFAVCLAVH